MEEYGITPIYDTGRVIINKNRKDNLYIYITVEFTDLPVKLPENILCIQTSEYFCKAVEKGAIFEYNTVFPNLKEEDKIITPLYNFFSKKNNVQDTLVYNEFAKIHYKGKVIPYVKLIIQQKEPDW